MKETVIIIFSLFLTFSCSSDDESQKAIDQNTSIIGVWNYTQRINICSNGDEENFIFSECFQMSTLTFFSNGDFDISEFQNNTGECIPTDLTNGKWEILEDKLLISFSDSNSVSSRNLIKLTEDTLIFGFEDENMTCEDGNIISLTSFEFRRAE